MGGLDWLAVPMWCGALGVSDVEDLMHRLSVIKLHRKPKEQG